ncbi:Predicted pyrophosphatase or phosphodiesterase, AlkP superfamily [Desulfoluna spongiiphila]|uniref:Predicted pyrophosphatase or phosphodiesterase, AlkP superfamily n=2 Tax=Desulfoluna spongiiphila TaxID=419481 RepID=A0A1G5FMN5_9BACT|nr:Predicted pyrophosphatase or phosphodiesterase, AlkP superfamily [Desulfoluna spongiiphila]
MNKTIRPSVVLVSIDAVKPEFIFDSERLGLNLPNLRKYFVENGTHASRGIKSVFPTFTYPCHQSIITGTHPGTHGIHTNYVFDPEGKHLKAYNWFVSERVQNLWHYTGKNGYVSVNVGFPTSVGADADYNIPEYWRDGTSLDSKILDAVSRPQGLVREAEKEMGQYPATDLSLKGDEKRLKFSSWLLENKVASGAGNNPFFLTTYIAAYDTVAHEVGTYGKEALEALEKIDQMLGVFIGRVHEMTGGNVVVCVVSDHGMLDNIGDIRPNTLFARDGLIKLDENGSVSDWKAWCQRSGGSGYIKLKNSDDSAVREKVEVILTRLQDDKDSGIMEVLTGRQAFAKRKCVSEFDYVLVTKPGYEIQEQTQGNYFKSEPTYMAQHGYSETFPEMRAAFFLEGVNIPKNKDINGMELVDIAPTLAHIMGFVIPTAEGRNVLEDNA